MPRQRRKESPTGIYHWIVRGVNQKKLFHSEADFECFFGLLNEHKVTFGVSVYHYCLMTNHVHVLLHVDCVKALSRFSYFVLRKYAHYYGKTHQWSGQVFRRIFKSLSVDREEYLLECGRYIERNPLQAGIVEKVGDYPYSSFASYAYSKPDSIITSSPAYLGLSTNSYLRCEIYRHYVTQGRPYEVLPACSKFKSIESTGHSPFKLIGT